MADSYGEWLERMQQASCEQQEVFMNDIARRLKRPRTIAAPAHPFRGAPEYWQEFRWSAEERVSQFTTNFESVGGAVFHMEHMDEVKAFITAKSVELSARYILRQNVEELAKLRLEEDLSDTLVSVWNTDIGEAWKDRAAEADIGIVVADYAVAYTGSITVLSSADKGRSVSLLPTVLIAVIPVERLKTRLGEVLADFDEAGPTHLPAGIHFISGPSRSADIENDLTIGVHGPGIVFALLVG
ncbi:LUD domain-containing protein [Paenibacillus sp. 19GGS1-52]|uniref:LutC/YkgG family protein n=1 Tax=Paenibacillus sp. 19GGS1-52 TaxID=2758563 RepID=UPI001EFBBF4D|nr:LUD domain-containing protein [Paenibacillus sp. 19GGS1-52]ULO05592.1 LUD domain-containing protein [Paenibacillus sp. 19GGS1-52]